MDQLTLAAAARGPGRRAAGSGQRAAEAAAPRRPSTAGTTLRQTVIALPGGRTPAVHENPGRRPCTCWPAGCASPVSPAAWDGRSGDLLTVPQGRHSLEALEDAAVLLTVVNR